jgi:hypothetical protein
VTPRSDPRRFGWRPAARWCWRSPPADPST